MRRACLTAAVLVASAGCMTAEQRAAYQQSASRQLVCDGKDQCDIAWGRAVAWISMNCRFKIHTQTDLVVETEGPLPSPSTDIACRANRVPLGHDRAEIDFAASCGNIFGCVPDVLEVRARFSDSIAAVLTAHD